MRRRTRRAVIGAFAIGRKLDNDSRRDQRKIKTGGCGRSSVVEHQLPKLSVVGSIPIARSNLSLSDPETWVTDVSFAHPATR